MVDLNPHPAHRQRAPPNPETSLFDTLHCHTLSSHHPQRPLQARVALAGSCGWPEGPRRGGRVLAWTHRPELGDLRGLWRPHLVPHQTHRPRGSWESQIRPGNGLGGTGGTLKKKTKKRPQMSVKKKNEKYPCLAQTENMLLSPRLSMWGTGGP